MARKVQTPAGDGWKVGRRWLPFRLRRIGPDASDIAFLDIGDVGAIGALLLVLGVVLLLIFVVVPLLALAVQVIVLLLALIVGVLLRVLFRRPWTVVARRTGVKGAGEHAWQVKGWRGSGDVVDAAAERLARGEALPPSGAWPAI